MPRLRSRLPLRRPIRQPHRGYYAASGKPPQDRAARQNGVIPCLKERPPQPKVPIPASGRHAPLPALRLADRAQKNPPAQRDARQPCRNGKLPPRTALRSLSRQRPNLSRAGRAQSPRCAALRLRYAPSQRPPNERRRPRSHPQRLRSPGHRGPSLLRRD